MICIHFIYAIIIVTNQSKDPGLSCFEFLFYSQPTSLGFWFGKHGNHSNRHQKGKSVEQDSKYVIQHDGEQHLFSQYFSIYSLLSVAAY